MGQYYRVAMINNEGHLKVIKPSGWKLMEHSYYRNRTMQRIEKLLFRNSWNVMRVWDYAECAPFVWKAECEDTEQRNYDNEYSDEEILERQEYWCYYLVNLFKKEFINMTEQEEKWLEIHPLPLLCRMETEEAWGDYHSEYGSEHIGKRAWDMISVYYGTLPLEEEFKKQWRTNKTKDYEFIEK